MLPCVREVRDAVFCGDGELLSCAEKCSDCFEEESVDVLQCGGEPR